MAEMTPFHYAGFWDVPRYIVLSYREQSLLLRSEFDDELDEYELNYAVFILPESARNSVRDGNWDFYNKTPMAEIGQVPVRAVVFDQSKRKELDASCLDSLLAVQERGAD